MYIHNCINCQLEPFSLLVFDILWPKYEYSPPPKKKNN